MSVQTGVLRALAFLVTVSLSCSPARRQLVDPAATAGPSFQLRGLVGAGDQLCVLDGDIPVCWGGASYDEGFTAPRRLHATGITKIWMGWSSLCLLGRAEPECIGWTPGNEHDELVKRYARN